MTREEAIAIQKAMRDNLHETGKDYPYRDYMIPLMKESCDIAIQALEQEPIHDVLDKIRAEITDWQNDIHDNEYDAEKHDFVFERIFEIIDEYRERDE